MKIRRTISIDKNDLDALKPFLEASGDNLSMALRKLISEYRQQNKNRIMDEHQKKMVLRNQIIENKIAELIPVPLIRWMVKTSLGLPPLGIFRPMIEKFPKLLGIKDFSLNEYMNMINSYGDIFGYQLTQHIELIPETRNIRISYEAEDSDHLRGAVIIYSSLLAHHPFNLKIKKMMDAPNLFIIDYEQCCNEEESYNSVKKYFGSKQHILEEIQTNLSFWINLVRLIKADNYDDIILNRDILNHLLKSRDFSDQLSSLIHNIYGVSIDDIDYKHLVRYIEEICKTNGLIQRLEYNDNQIRIFHTLDNHFSQSVNDTVIKTLEASNHHFMLKKKGKITTLSRNHR
ncbi:MAG: hypothetical protein FIB08_12340 [Candidatus Methanoperedens sp.]|nr:hypothetical protein [Candidatus Methanoperedens sp.]